MAVRCFGLERTLMCIVVVLLLYRCLGATTVAISTIAGAQIGRHRGRKGLCARFTVRRTAVCLPWDCMAVVLYAALGLHGFVWLAIVRMCMQRSCRGSGIVWTCWG